MANLKILIADDSESHLKLLSRAIREGNPEADICTASSRSEITSALQQHDYDCVVLDYILPPDSAASILQDVRSELGCTPVIVVSASREQRVVIESLRCGVSDFLTKEEALKPGVLLQRVQEMVQQSRESRLERRREDRRLRAMERLADTDPLTGLYNRRYIARVLESDRLVGDRRGRIACVMADIDHFKRVNDSHGHEAGDQVLKKVASELREAAGMGIVARWGGEEFLVLLQSASAAEAWAWADRARERIATRPIELGDGSAAHLTVSFGVSVVPTCELGPDLMRRADHALYLAKDHGRDRVCSWAMVEAMDKAQDAAAVGTGMLGTLSAFLSAVGDMMGPVQYEHVVPHGLAVRDLTRRLAAGMGMRGAQLDELGLAAQLHDIGKVCIPEVLLAKPDTLTMSERRCIDAHARFGADLAGALGASEYVCGVIAEHHVRYDSRPAAGYEMSAAGVALGASIVSTADAIVAMTSSRPYAARRSKEQVISEVRLQRGHQFAPDVVDTFLALDPAVVAA